MQNTEKVVTDSRTVAGITIEKDCTITHKGQSFEAGGAVITPDAIVAYPKENGVLGDWHGNSIGTWRAVSTWRTPKSFVSSTLSQIEAHVDGIAYTGRGAGVGMIYKGRRINNKRRFQLKK